jgi:SNF2 family DNA or RNA helicase
MDVLERRVLIEEVLNSVRRLQVADDSILHNSSDCDDDSSSGDNGNGENTSMSNVVVSNDGPVEVLMVLTNLRKLCSHPGLLEKKPSTDMSISGHVRCRL